MAATRWFPAGIRQKYPL